MSRSALMGLKCRIKRRTCLEEPLNAIHQRCFRSWHHKVDPVFLCQRHHTRVVIYLHIWNVDNLRCAIGCSAITWDDEYGIDMFGLIQLPCKGMLSSSIAD